MFFSCKSIKKKNSRGGEFADTLYELLDFDYIELQEIRDLIDEYGLKSVTCGIKKKPWLVHMFLSRLEGESDDEIKLELEIFEMLVNCYPDVVNIPVDGKYGYGSEGEKYYPLHAACQNLPVPTFAMRSFLAGCGGQLGPP